MTTIFIANSTKQHTTFYYRLGFADPNVRESPAFRLGQMPCPPGGQVRLFDGDGDDANKIILQLAQMGAVDAAELSSRQRDTIRAVFSVDKPVDMNKVRAIIERNGALMSDKGYLQRKQLAVAAHTRMNEQAMEFGPDSPRPHNLIMELQEVQRPGQEGGGIETLEVATPGHEPRAKQGNRRARAAA